jgi:hypothetical protein|tara:strand:+ start:1143 stop:1811 length:669 start_codon:yes stop_codon:yes gene_type:complete
MECKWCKKSFKSETTLAVHMCVKKRRFADKDMTHIRLSHRAFQMFYDLNTSAKHPKTMEDFILSPYYESFVKFGRACQVNEWLQPEKFTEWLIKTGVKLKLWISDAQYDKFLKEYVKKEPGLRALERTIIYMAKWGEENNEAWQSYFVNVSPSRAVYDIRSGKVSPWVLYLSDTGGTLLERFNDEQVKMIQDNIDPPFWMKLFKKNKDEVAEIKETCERANL